MTSHLALAYIGGNGLAARVVPCVLRCGVWAVARQDDKRAPWAVHHAPSGAQVDSYATKRDAVAVCKRLGKALGMWHWDCGFGDPPACAKVAKIARLKPLVRVG